MIIKRQPRTIRSLYAFRPSTERWRTDLEMQISDGPIDIFDFDSLPPRRPRFAHPSAASPVHRRSPHSQSQNSYLSHTQSPTAASPTRGAAPSIVTQSTAPEPRRSRFHLRVQFADQKEKGGSASAGTPSQRGEMSLASPRSVIAHVQSMCSPDNAAAVVEKEREKAQGGSTHSSINGSPKGGSPVSTSSPMTFGPPGSSNTYTYRGASPTSRPISESTRGPPMSWESAAVTDMNTKVSWRERFRRVSAVPAFKSPLTPVLNPVVSRAQWEIVVRSALIALVLSVVIIAALVAIP